MRGSYASSSSSSSHHHDHLANGYSRKRPRDALVEESDVGGNEEEGMVQDLPPVDAAKDHLDFFAQYVQYVPPSPTTTTAAAVATMAILLLRLRLLVFELLLVYITIRG